MRVPSLIVITCLLASAAAAEDPPSVAPAGRTITLEEAMRLALAQNRELAARRAEVAEARARLVTARTRPFNPELSIGGGRRRSPGRDSSDSSVAIGQEIEIGGQPARRKATATAELEAIESRLERSRQVLIARVELAFSDALRAEETSRVDAADLELAQSSLGIARKRLEAGASTDLEVNLARAADARAASRLQRSRAASDVARYLLAEALGSPPDEVPAPAPTQPDLSRDPGDLDALLALARARRADLAAFQALVKASDARIALARAERVPNLSVGLFHDSEAGTDSIDGATFGIALPIFNKGRGAVAEAVASRARTEAERDAAGRSIEREVAESWATYRAARAVVDRLGGDMVGALEDSLGLLRKSQEAGKIGIGEVLIFRRELLDSQRELVAARADAWRARILLDLAAGMTPVQDEPGLVLDARP